MKRTWITILSLLASLTVSLLAVGIFASRQSSGNVTGTAVFPAGTVIVAGASSSPSPSPTPSPTIPPPPTPRMTDPDLTKTWRGPGAPGITPRVPNASPGVPTFTVDDVRAYYTTGQVDFGKARPTGPYQIGTITFLTSGEARTLGIETGRPDTTLLCIVTLQGTWVVTGPVGTQPVTLHTLTQYFDARTGNLWGQLGKP